MKKKLVELLVTFGMIGRDYTGQITIHFNQGSIVSYDKYTKGLKIE